MPKEPLVSIIMNCYNGEKYLRVALDSVIAQTYQKWELIFWDNQSTDQSKELFMSYDDERLNYFNAPKHTLLYEARNYAIEKASGEFYAFLDVDDWWVKEKLEKQIPLFNDPEVGLVYGKYLISNATQTRTRLPYMCAFDLPNGYITNDLLSSYVVALLTIIVRKKAFDNVNYFDSKYHIIGDYDLSIKISLQWKLECLQEPIAFYRSHHESESHKRKEKYIEELCIWYKENYKKLCVYKNINHIKLLIFHEKALLMFKHKKFNKLCNLISKTEQPIDYIGLIIYLIIKNKYFENIKILIITLIYKIRYYCT
jgi:glycosyltransferase involved in cell wall biosynthesis